MYYSPVLRNNKTTPLPWQLKTFYINMTWPLQDHPKPWMQLLSTCLLFVEFLAFVFFAQGSVRFIIKNFKDINLNIEALASLIVLIECSLRIFHMAFKRSSFKLFLQDFYSTIYFDEKENPEVYRKIQRSLTPTRIFSYGYVVTVVSFLALPVLSPFLGRKAVLPCNIVVDYAIDDSLNYNLTMLVLSGIGIWIFLFFIGEAFLWANCMLHLNERYSILQDEMESCSSYLIKTVAPSRLALEFRRNILRMFIKACDLNNFSVRLDAAYNLRIFVMISFSAIMICIVCYQIVEIGQKSKNLAYVSWLVAKISELLIFGTLGSIIIDTTDKVSSMYYLSNWEEIIYRSTDTKQNILLLKDLQVVISLHRKPIHMTGLNFVVISLATIEKVLRVSGSYFAFLYTIKQRTMT